MARHQDGETPARQHVMAGRDAYIDGGALHVYPASRDRDGSGPGLDEKAGAQADSGNTQVNYIYSDLDKG
jgi:hypothetical protein